MADVGAINQIVITAKDDTGAAFQSVATNLGNAGKQVTDLVNKYDPLGAKLRELTADFATLNAAVTKGSLAGSESTTDAIYQKINADIAATQAAMTQAGAAGATGFKAITAAGEDTIHMTTRSKTEFIVFADEILNGRFTRIPGSILVMAQGVRGLGSAFVAVGGVIAAAAVGIGIFALAAVKAAQETAAFNESLAKSGDYAGQTVASMHDLAAALTSESTATLGQSKALVLQLVSSGKIGEQSIAAVAQATESYAEATGISLQKAGAAMIKAFEDPGVGAEKLNETMHLLTVADVEYIKSLTDAGQAEEARLVLAGKIDDALRGQIPNLGSLATAWNAVKNAASDAWNSMMSVGRAQTTTEQMASLSADIARLKTAGSGGGYSAQADPALLAADEAELANLREQAVMTQRLADITGQRAQEAQQLQKYDDLVDKSNAHQITQQQQLLAQIILSHAAIVDSGKTEAEYQSTVLGIEEKIQQLEKTKDVKKTPDDSGAALSLGLEQAKADIAQEQQLLQQRDAMLTLYHSKLGMSDDAYYAGREAARQAALTAENNDYNAEMTLLANYVNKNSKEYDETQTKMAEVTAAHDKFVASMSQAGVADDTTALAAQNKVYADMVTAINKAGDASVSSLQKQLAALLKYNSTMGLTKEQVDALAEAKQNATIADEQSQVEAIQDLLQRNDLTQTQIDLYTAYLAKLKEELSLNLQIRDASTTKAEQQASIDAAKAAGQEWIKTDKQIESGLTDAFLNAFKSGKDFATSLRDALVRMFDNLVLKPVIQAVMAPIAGAATSALLGYSAPASAANTATGIAGAVGQGSSLLNLFGIGGTGAGASGFASSVGNFFTSTGITSLGSGGIFAAGGALSGFATGAAGQALGLSTAVGVNASLGAADAGLTTLGETIGAAIPVVGWVVALAALAYSLFGNKGGGPKSGGSWDPNSILNNRFFTPNSADSQLATLGAGTQTSYTSAFQTLGGTGSGPAQFALGYDTDPQGTANSRVSGVVSVGGQRVFNQQNVDAGRGDTALQAAITLETQRAMLAALQNSGLTQGVTDMLNTIVAATATTQQITDVLTFAQAMKDVVSAMDPKQVEESAAAIKTASDAAATAIAAGGSAVDVTEMQKVVGAALNELDPALGKVEEAFKGTAAEVLTFSDTLVSIYDGLQKVNDPTFSAGVDAALSGATQATATEVLAFVGIVAEFGSELPGVGADLEQLSGSDIPDFITALGGAASALSFFNYLQQNFLTTAQRTAYETNDLTTTFAKYNATVPTTHQGFLDFLNGIDLTTQAGKDEYAAIAAIAPEWIAVNGTADQAAASLNGTSTALNATTTAANAAAAMLASLNEVIVTSGGIQQDAITKAQTDLNNFATLAQQSPGDFGAQLGIQIGLIASAMTTAGAKLGSGGSYSFTNRGTPADIGTSEYLNTINASRLQLTDELARFTILTAQYGSAQAQQLVQLEDWYTAQVKIFGGGNDAEIAIDQAKLAQLQTVNQTAYGIKAQEDALTATITQLSGNTSALSALSVVYKQKWDSIISATASGTSAVQSSLGSIGKYLQGLAVGSLSTLTPMQQLAQAQIAYQAEFEKALSGNQAALADVTQYADTYLKLEQGAYASSSTYQAAEGAVTQQLGTLAGTTPLGSPVDSGTLALVAALPSQGGTLASTSDVQSQTQALITVLTDLITALANANTQDSQTEIQELQASIKALQNQLASTVR